MQAFDTACVKALAVCYGLAHKNAMREFKGTYECRFMALMLAMLLLVKATLPGFIHMQPRESTLGTIFSNAFVVCTATGFQYVTVNQGDGDEPVAAVKHDCLLCISDDFDPIDAIIRTEINDPESDIQRSAIAPDDLILTNRYRLPFFGRDPPVEA